MVSVESLYVHWILQSSFPQEEEILKWLNLFFHGQFIVCCIVPNI